MKRLFGRVNMSNEELKEYEKKVDEYFEKVNSSPESAREYLISLEEELDTNSSVNYS